MGLENILRDFLLEQKSEVIKMGIYEKKQNVKRKGR